MRFTHFSTLLLALLVTTPICFGQIATSQEEKKTTLTKKTIEHLNHNLLSALRMGDSLRTVEAIGPLFQRLNEEQLKEVNETLAEMKLPSLEDLSADSWLNIVRTGGNTRKIKLSWNETLVVVPVLKKRIDAALDAITSHELMKLEIIQPDDLDEYESGLWDLHVFQNDLESTNQLAVFAQKLTVPLKQKLNRVGQDITDDQHRALSTDYAAIVDQIEKLKIKLTERDAEVRVLRIQDAEQILAESTDPARRIEAVFAVEFDAIVLNDLFAEKRKSKKGQQGGEFQSEVLNDSTLVDFVSETIESARKFAGESGKKSRLLFAGLHWWERGRYGAGPLAGGLLKSPEVMNNEQVMFQLFMPKEFPTPTDPVAKSEAGPTNVIDRRHHYDWRVEYRPITIGAQSSRSDITGETPLGEISTETTTTHMSKFY